MAYHRKPPTLETLREELANCRAALPVNALTKVGGAVVQRTQKLMVGTLSSYFSSTHGATIRLCVNQIWVTNILFK